VNSDATAMMIDLKAPILPGRGAAGVLIGAEISRVLPESSAFRIDHRQDGIEVYRSDSVDLWTKNLIIFQIGVHGQYEGKLLGSFGLGSGLRELQDRVGPVELDDEDNLVLKGVPGLSFEIDPDAELSPITEFYVYRVP